MANEVTKFTPGFLGARPAHLSTSFGDDTNLNVGGGRVPSLTFQNRIFKIDANGEDHRLTKTIDGETVPVPAIPVIILGFAERRNRVYYKGTFDSSNVRGPDCWSSDGLKPDDQVPEKINPNCSQCPMSAKGSKVTDNNKTVSACQERRIAAVVPSKGLDKFPPLRLSLPITSDYDGRSPHNDQNGKFAFSNYIEFIRNNGAKQSYDLVTRISFDTTEGVTFPKLLFSPLDWVGSDDAEKVKAMLDSGAVDAALGQSEGAQQAAVAQKMNAETQGNDKATTAKGKKGNGTAATTAKVEAKEDPAIAESAKKAGEAAQRKRAAQDRAKAAAEEAARLAKEAEEDGLGEDDATVAAADGDTGEVDPRNPPAGLAADEEVNDIINQWGDD